HLKARAADIDAEVFHPDCGVCDTGYVIRDSGTGFETRCFEVLLLGSSAQRLRKPGCETSSGEPGTSVSGGRRVINRLRCRWLHELTQQRRRINAAVESEAQPDRVTSLFDRQTG